MMTLLCTLLALGGAYVIAMNWMCVFANLRNARENIDKHHSLAPIAGPLLLVVGLGNLLPGIGWLLLLPVLIDPGTWILLYSIPFLASQTTGARE